MTGDAPAAAAAAAAAGQVVLVLQGGGALGAYQWGVYDALHEAGVEPDWVIGTSIGAINAALIAGNDAADRAASLRRFWTRVERHPLPAAEVLDAWGVGRLWSNATTTARGIPGFFEPNPAAFAGIQAPVGVERASYYCTDPLRGTLAELAELAPTPPRLRLTVGAVHVLRGEMRYFDSRRDAISVDHVVASGALPPAFPAVRIDGEPYWDGGVYSNTPLEAVLDDHPRRDSLIFAVNVWHQRGPEPASIWEVMAREKDIQYASRADSHIARQKQIHRLRHVIRELRRQIPASLAATERVADLAAYGCNTTMHIAHLQAPQLDAEDSTKDIDFTRDGIARRHAAGVADTRSMLARAPWLAPHDPLEGVIEHH